MIAGDLRHHARSQHVAQEDVGVAGQRNHALLDARAARIVEPDHRASVFIARSITLQTFSANAPDRLPPKTVKSCEKTQTWRPSIVP